MAMINKYVETEVEVEIDGDDIAQLVSDEGLTPGDLFSDAEIQEAAENIANWEGWLEKAIEEMSESRIAEMLAGHGYVKKNSLARNPCPACGKPMPPDAPCLCALAPAPAVTSDALVQAYIAADPEDRAKFRHATGLDTALVREEMRAEVRREIMARLFD